MKHLSTVIISAAICSMTLTNCASKTGKNIDKANLDESVSPKEDFYDYACGGWIASNPLPAEYSRYGTFDRLAENCQKQIHDLIIGLDSLDNEAGSNAQKIADLYAMGMDSVKRNEQGAKALANDLAKINSLTRGEIPAVMAVMPGVDAFYATGVSADVKNADMNIMYVEQSGLGLGNPDYYTQDDENTKNIREAYINYLQTIAKLAGYTDADAKRLADNTMEIENKLAKASMTRLEQRDVNAQYNPMLVSDIDKQYPALKLAEYFAAEGINQIDTVIVGQPKFIAEANAILANTPEQALRDYIAAGYISSAANYLSDDFENAAFELSKVISGVQEQQPRWKRAMGVPNRILGEALGQLYAEKYFPASSKEKMKTLVANLQQALGQHIDSLTWMSDATKAKAHEKLNTFTVKIGYPDKWRDYSALTIDPEKTYWENMQAAIKFNADYNLADFGKPVDKSRWHMTPQTVNAYYNPTTNEICFPAGILQNPFFDPEADDAVNYGAIGVVIGHEMTHGFDDSGRQFDANGNLRDWWTPEDAEAFTKLADALADQFDQIVVIDSLHANGKLTLGENIADQGGLRVSHTAYLNSLGGNEAPVIDGLTADQRFYLAYANVWAANIRDEEIVNRTKNDVHSLGRWRVNASLRNLQPFFDAFGIQEGDKMFRPEAERVIIW